MKKVLIMLLPCYCLLLLSACNTEVPTTSTEPELAILGEVSTTVEVGTVYVDPGVKHPTNYIVNTRGEVDTNTVGKYQIDYVIYSDLGEKIKSLSRMVYIVDTEGPSYIAKETKDIIFYTAVQYSINDFIESYKDKGTKIEDIQVVPNTTFMFKEGLNSVSIDFIDDEGNINSFTKEINVVSDIKRILESTEFKAKYSVTKTFSSALETDIYRVKFSNGASFSYMANTKTFHYLKSFDTELGESASIQISCSSDDLKNARINYHVNNDNDYSVIFVTFDATKNNSPFNFTTIRSSINNLNLNTDDMLIELNAHSYEMINGFKDFVRNALYKNV